MTKACWLLAGIFWVFVSTQACAPTALEEAEELSLANTLGAQGMLYFHQGKYSQAEPLLKRVLAIYEKAQGPEGHGVAKALHGLGVLYASQGKYAEAEPFLARARAIREKYAR